MHNHFGAIPKFRGGPRHRPCEDVDSPLKNFGFKGKLQRFKGGYLLAVSGAEVLDSCPTSKAV